MSDDPIQLGDLFEYPEPHYEQKLEKAIEQCIRYCLSFRREGGFYVPEFDEEAVPLSAIAKPVWEVSGQPEQRKFAGFDIDDQEISIWEDFLTGSEATHRILLDAIASNFFLHRPLPPNLEFVAFKYLKNADDYRFSKKLKARATHRDLLLAQLGNYLQDRYEFPFAASPEKTPENKPYPHTGVLIAASAMNALGAFYMSAKYAHEAAYKVRAKAKDKTDIASLGRLVGSYVRNNSTTENSNEEIRSLVAKARDFLD